MQAFLRIWLLVVVLYVGGVFSTVMKIWPAPAILEAYFYVTDNRWETRNLKERLWNDMGWLPYRLLTRDAGGAPEGDYRVMALEDLKERRQAPHVYVADDRAAKLTFIYGVFDFTDGLHGAILLDPDGKVMRRWTLSENPEALESQPNTRLYPHGVVIDPSGAITYIFDFGTQINKVDACGDYVWTQATHRDYNHALSWAADGSIWTLSGDPSWFERIDNATGEVLQSISMGDLLAANPDLGIFSARSEHYAQGRQWNGDPFHGNDVEELTPAMAAAFPMFEPGDLLVSFRNLNLVFVFDPDTLAVKWWRSGFVQQQHDPDWMDDGTFMVFDNRWDNPPSRLVSIDPATYEVKTVLDGHDYDFFTINRGKSQKFGDDLIVTSSKQGRVFEVNKSGEITFEFINTYDDSNGLRALVSEAIALPVDYFKELPKCD